MTEIIIAKRLSIDSLVTDPWHLMKGKKRYFWLLLLPAFLVAGYGIYLFADVLFAISLSVKNFHDLEHFNFTGSLGNLSITHAVLGGLIMAFVFTYVYFAEFIVGCDVVQNIPFSRSRLLYIFKRMWPGIFALIIIEVIKLALFLLPIAGWFINLILDPFFMLYLLRVVYHQGPFTSLAVTWRALRGNFWRWWVGYYVVVVITGLLCMTLIGAIWGIPFMMIAFGIINRDFLEQ